MMITIIIIKLYTRVYDDSNDHKYNDDNNNNNKITSLSLYSVRSELFTTNPIIASRDTQIECRAILNINNVGQFSKIMLGNSKHKYFWAALDMIIDYCWAILKLKNVGQF